MPHAIQTSNSHISVKNGRQNLGIVAKRRISCYYIQANPAAAHQQEMKKVSEKLSEKKEKKTRPRSPNFQQPYLSQKWSPEPRNCRKKVLK